MKVLLISLNSLKEGTGGGIYLRTLFSLYQRSDCTIKTLAKKGENDSFGLNKNVFTDFLSRILLCPSFLGAYIFTIIKQSKDVDVISFHSSRLGMLALLIKIFFPRKKVIIHSDNVESKLIKDIIVVNGLAKKSLVFADKILIPLSEWLCAKFSDKITFITSVDRDFYINKYNCDHKKCFIIPVLIDNKKQSLCSYNNGSILFTGSFDFYPNQDAFKRLIKLVKAMPDYQFVVAGRSLAKFAKENDIEPLGNLTLHSDVTPQHLDALYTQASIFLCPVTLGSGMKTKIAEALSYNLHVIAHQDSAHGYEAAITDKVLVTVKDDFFEVRNVEYTQNVIKKILALSKKNNSIPYETYKRNYSIDAGLNNFKRIIE